MFIGVTVNTLAVIVCSVIGLVCKKIINDRIENTMMQALGVCVMIIGITDAIKPVNGVEGVLVMVISFALGGLIGALLNIEKGLDNLGKGFEKLVLKNSKNHKEGSFSEGFTQATMIFCIGAMVIYGSIADGLGNPQTLLIKSVLDGVMALLLTVKFGVGVAFSAIPILLIQGSISLIAFSVGDFLSGFPNFIGELTAIGGVFVTMIGINILGIKKLPIANMLPAILGACYYLIF